MSELGLLASSCVMSSLISALTSLLADMPRCVPNKESSSCSCSYKQLGFGHLT